MKYTSFMFNALYPHAVHVNGTDVMTTVQNSSIQLPDPDPEPLNTIKIKIN
jgi:hypothetical protein